MRFIFAALIPCIAYLLHGLSTYQIACDAALDAMDFRMYVIEGNVMELNREVYK